MIPTRMFWHNAFALAGAMLILFSSCEKEKEKNVPVVSTAEVEEITQTTDLSGGNITDDGGATVTARGVVWSTTQNPTLESNQDFTTDGTDG